MLWGFKDASLLGRHSEHVEPSRPRKTHVQVERMSGGYNVISGILNVTNVVRQYVVTEKVFPDTNMPDMPPFLVQ